MRAKLTPPSISGDDHMTIRILFSTSTMNPAQQRAVDETVAEIMRSISPALPRLTTFSPKRRHGVLKRGRRKNLSAHAEAKVQRVILHAWAESTLKKYEYGLEAYWKFCDTEGVAIDKRLPADEFLLCAFAASRAGEIAGGTVRGSIAAVKAWHVIHDEHWRGGVRLRYTLRGVENLTPASSKQEQRPPVTADMLNALGRGLDQDAPLDAAVFGAACCALWGQIRLGEILSDNQGSYKEGRIPLAADLAPPSTSAGSRMLRLPWTKTKREKGDNAMLCRQKGPADPINAIENHLRVNDVPPNLPLFAYRNKSGDFICLAKKKFIRRCNEVWSELGYPCRTGHSFRIGGTTELLLAGVSPSVVQVMGRWLSEAFLVYWRKLDLLAPLHAEYLDM
ncbi:hypothetical protein C8R44DRAFT_294902 [Mycena epipterygia]|nr:hypothetical protein C8R44DRAFT_945717 [Mycena epipterygia]KAJ7108656.1 hypothetical protein C8R44DRAFT_294902 [Mycena epipterygia]